MVRRQNSANVGCSCKTCLMAASVFQRVASPLTHGEIII
jgi:hypothetical protein